MNEFNALTSTLSPGIYSIEANAGTGKTYTLENLFIRLIREQKLDLSQILVLTFTNQAVAELKKRLGARLINAVQVNEHDESHDPGVLDKIEVYTFHAFFLKIVNEFWFYSSDAPTTKIEANADVTFRKLIDRFMRKYAYQNDEFTAFLFEEMGMFFSDMDKSLRFFSNVYETYSDTESFDDKTLQLEISGHIQAVGALIEKYNAERTPFLDYVSDTDNIVAKRFNKNHRSKFIENIQKTGDLSTENPFAAFRFLDGCFPKTWSEKLKNPDRFPFLFLERIDDVRRSLTQLKQNFLVTLSGFLHRNLVGAAETSGVSFFERLQKAAVSLCQEPAVRSVLSERYRAVLADESQDTDHAQKIFLQSLFYDNKHFAYVVGDAKQSIYQFRGASLFTSDKNHSHSVQKFSLSTNFRSGKNIIDAVNTIFSEDQNPFLYSDFISNTPSAFPAGKENGQNPASEFVLNMIEVGDEKKTADELRIIAYQTLAKRITELTGSSEAAAPKTLGDIAVLVRKNYEAQKLADVFQGFGIPCSLFTKEKLSTTEQAKDLYLLLRLIFFPTVSDLASSVINNSLLGYSVRDFSDLKTGQKAEDLLTVCYNARQIWEQYGVFAAFDYCDRHLTIGNRLLNSPYGIQAYRNCLDFVGLLRNFEAEQGLPPQALLEQCEQILQNGSGGIDETLRLIVPENAVRIYTVHAAKGLEFPCVFYLFSNAKPKIKDLISFHDPENNFLRRNAITDEDYEVYKKETAAEEVRIFYVAVTRPTNYCEIIAHKNDIESSSIVNRINSIETPCIKKCVTRVSDNQQNETVSLPAEIQRPQIPAPRLTGEFARREFTGVTMRSFSSLITKNYVKIHSVHSETTKPDDPTSSDKPIDSETSVSSNHTDPIQVTDDEKKQEISDNKTHELPAGISGLTFGSIVHEVIEVINWKTLEPTDIRSKAQKIILDYGCDTILVDIIEPMVCKMLTKKLTDSARQVCFSLSEISPVCQVKEMMFSLKLDGAPLYSLLSSVEGTGDLIHLLKRSLKLIKDRDPVHFLDGIIDAVVEFDGKLYILDWKTNYLGDRIEDYNQKIMESEMETHGYFLQLILYAVALKGYLAERIERAPFESIFGGVFYLFVRGIDSNHANNGIFFCPPADIIRIIEQFDPFISGRKQ